MLPSIDRGAALARGVRFRTHQARGIGTPLVEAMRLAGAGCALVFSRPDSDRVEDLVGVLTLRELSVYRSSLAHRF